MCPPLWAKRCKPKPSAELLPVAQGRWGGGNKNGAQRGQLGTVQVLKTAPRRGQRRGTKRKPSRDVQCGVGGRDSRAQGVQMPTFHRQRSTLLHPSLQQRSIDFEVNSTRVVSPGEVFTGFERRHARSPT